MNKSLAALLGAVAAAASLASADLVLAQAKAGKDAAKEAPKAYSGPEAHQACAKAAADKRDACIRNLPVQVFAPVKAAPAAAAAKAEPKKAEPAKAEPAKANGANGANGGPKAYMGPKEHLACAKAPADKRDTCIRNLPVVKGPGFSAAPAPAAKTPAKAPAKKKK
jgi:hypothetical protein